MLFDSHIHTEFSMDSTETIENYLKKARELGVGFISTEHLDLNMKAIHPDYYEEFSPEEYKDTYGRFRGPDFLIGVECGLDPDYADASKEYIDRIGADFILGSIHTLKGEDLYPREYFLSREREDFYRNYFTWGLECLKAHPYVNSLAHIDYPARYNPYLDPGFTYQEFRDELEPLFRYMGEKDIALELNLRRFWNPEITEELESIYRGFRSCGGRLVTIGSDSHKYPTLGRDIDTAYEFMKSLGLTVVHYENQRPVEDSL